MSDANNNNAPEPAQQNDDNDNDNEYDNEENIVRFTVQFKDDIRAYIEKDDKQTQLNAELKQIRAEKAEIQKRVLQFMEDNNVPMFKTQNGGGFERKIRKTSKSLNKDTLASTLVKSGQLKDASKVDELITYVWNERPKQEKVELLRKK